MLPTLMSSSEQQSTITQDTLLEEVRLHHLTHSADYVVLIATSWLHDRQ